MRHIFMIILLQIFYFSNALGAVICTLTITPVAFGQVNVMDLNIEETTATGTVTCTENAGVRESVSYEVTFGPGSSGDFNNRIMDHTNLTDTLAYNIHHKINYNRIYADGSGNTKVFAKSYRIKNKSRTHTFTIFARIPVQSLANVGNYNDTIIATLTYQY